MVDWFTDSLRRVLFRVGDGTGFSVSPHCIITARHVIRGHEIGSLVDIQGCEETENYKAEVVQIDDACDTAALRTTAKLQHFAPVHDSLSASDKVYGLGYPLPAQGPEPFYGEAEGSSQAGIKFKDTQLKAGWSGSPLLNFSTGCVCGLVVRSRDTRLQAGGVGRSLSELIKSADGMSQPFDDTFFAWHSRSTLALFGDVTSKSIHFNILPIEDSPDLRASMVSPRFRKVVDGKPDHECSATAWLDTCKSVLSSQRFLPILGGYGVGKSIHAKRLQYELHRNGWFTAYLPARYCLSHLPQIEAWAHLHHKRGSDACLFVDGIDETHVIRSGVDGERLAIEALLQLSSNCSLHIVATTRAIPMHNESGALMSVTFLDYLSLEMLSALPIPKSLAIEFLPFDKSTLDSWLAMDFDRRSATECPVANPPPTARSLKLQRNNLLHSCQNPLFAYIYADAQHQAGDSFAGIYGIYENFVAKTIKGKYVDERQKGHGALVRVLADRYRYWLQEFAVSIASLHDLAFESTDLQEWRIDRNIKLYVLPSEAVTQALHDILEKSLTPAQRSGLDASSVQGTVLACYFFEERDQGWRFSDNNILFFLLAEVLLDELLKASDAGGFRGVLTQAMPRFARAARVPIHPVIVRMVLAKLKDVEKDARQRLFKGLQDAALDGDLLTGRKLSEDAANEDRLSLYCVLTLMHIKTEPYAMTGSFFRDLEILLKRLMARDRQAFDVFRASLRGCHFVDALWEGHDLRGYNLSECNLSNVHFRRCSFDDVVAHDARFHNVVIALADRVSVKADRMRGSLRIENCPWVEVVVSVEMDFSLEIVRCDFVKLDIKQADGCEHAPTTKITLCNCDDVQKAFARGLSRLELRIVGGNFHTFNVSGSRVFYEFSSGAACKSTATWTKDRHTKLYDLHL